MRCTKSSPAGVLAVLCALALAPSASVSAQRFDRDGTLWFGFGLGAGSAALDCTGCVDGRDPGVTGYVRFGGAPTGSLLLGVELDTWLRRNDDVDQRLQSLTATAHWYPSQRLGLWLGASAGFTRYTEMFTVDDVATYGPSIGASAGWEHWLRPALSLDASVAYLRQLSGELEMNGTGLRQRARANLARLAIGILWWTARAERVGPGDHR